MNYTYPSAFNLASAIANARKVRSKLDAHNALIELCDALSETALTNDLHAEAYAALNAQDTAAEGIRAALEILGRPPVEQCCRGCEMPVGQTHQEFCPEIAWRVPPRHVTIEDCEGE